MEKISVIMVHQTDKEQKEYTSEAQHEKSGLWSWDWWLEESN